MTLHELRKTESGLKIIAEKLKPMPHTVCGDALLNALDIVRGEIRKEERRRNEE